MTPGARLRRVAGRLLFVAPACLCLLAPGAASAKAIPGDLSSRLAKLSKPSVADMSHAKQASRLGLAASGPGSLIRSGNRVLVDVRFASGGVDLGSLRSAGAQIVHVSRRYGTVTTAVAPDALRDVAAVSGVEGVTENLAPMIAAAGGDSSPPPPETSVAGCLGAATSEGDLQLHAADARSDFGVDGTGVKVGILSDSYDQATQAADNSGPVATHAAQDIASGDLPGAGNPCGLTTPVQIVGGSYQQGGGSAPTDEGRAMAQIVHDLAPGAPLAFATAFNGELSFADNIRALQAAGAKVIADDVSYPDEPFFQDGPVSAAVNDVTAAGSNYFSAAGNNNLVDGSGRNIASWEAPAFRPSGGCPAGMAATFSYAVNCMDFNPGAGTDRTFGVTVSSGATLTVDLQWAEPWYGVQTDLDLYLLDASGNPVTSGGSPVSSEDDNPNTQEPFELLQWKNTTGSSQAVQLAINRCDGTCNSDATVGTTPRLKFALLQNGGGVTAAEYPSSGGGDVVGPTIFGHNGAANTTSVGAVRYNNGTQPESYSSRGDPTLYFAPVSGTTPAAKLGSPQTLNKPDIAATDCGATTFFAQLVGSTWRFCGTSAAAPHAAAVAALLLQAVPGATVAQVRSALTSTAVPVGSPSDPDAVGAGLLNADAALGSMLPSIVTITGHPPNITSDNTPTFSFTNTGSVDHFTCAFDGGGAQPCAASPSNFTAPTPLSDGPHSFQVVARGPSPGNAILGTGSYSFTVDTKPPTVTVKSGPTGPTNVRTPSFGFSADEPAQFACSLDGGGAQPCNAGTFTAPSPLADGPHSLAVVATDPAGNVGSTSASFSVDTRPPVVTLNSGPADRTADDTPSFGFAADKPVNFSCVVDEGAPRACASPYRVSPPLADGVHTFMVVATDQAGNTGDDQTAFTVDTTPPTVTILRAPARVSVRRWARFVFSSEPGARFMCRHDLGRWRPCADSVSLRVGAGRHGFAVRATDSVGNVGPVARFHWRVKRQHRAWG